MRRSLVLLLLILVCALPVARCKKEQPSLAGVVDFIAGAVRVSTAGNTAPAKIGDIIREGMTIATAERSFARVSFGEDVLSIYELTELSFTALSRDPDSGAGKTEMRMEKGTILSNVALKLSKGDSHRVSSDTMIAAVRGTEYLYSVDGASGLVACYRGAVSVLRAGSDEEVLLNAGEMVWIREGKKMKAEKIPAGFRHRDFEYGKDPSDRAAAVMDRGGEPAAASVKTRAGDAQARGTGAVRTAGEQTTAAAPQKSAAAKKAVADSAAAPAAATVKKSGAAVSAPRTATTAAAPKKRTQAGGTASAAGSAAASKKQAQTLGGKTAEPAASAEKKEAAAEKKKEEAAAPMTAGKDAAEAGVDKADAVTEGQKQPGALLEKPRVGMPEVK